MHYLAEGSGTPVLMLHGNPTWSCLYRHVCKDPAFGKERYIRRWQGYFPDAAVDGVEDASHYLQEDCPDRVAAAVKRLLEPVHVDGG